MATMIHIFWDIGLIVIITVKDTITNTKKLQQKDSGS